MPIAAWVLSVEANESDPVPAVRQCPVVPVMQGGSK